MTNMNALPAFSSPSVFYFFRITSVLKQASHVFHVHFMKFMINGSFKKTISTIAVNVKSFSHQSITERVTSAKHIYKFVKEKSHARTTTIEDSMLASSPNHVIENVKTDKVRHVLRVLLSINEHGAKRSRVRQLFYRLSYDGKFRVMLPISSQDL